MTAPQSITEELQKVAPSAVIELFELRLVAALHGSSDIYRFHSGVNGKNDGGNVVWAGSTYTAFPVECDGFEYSGNGQLPRPKLRVANVLGTITTVLLAVNAITPGNDLLGAKVIRRRTLARYLDAVNFPGNVNPYGTPDSTAEFPEEVYYISRKVVENRDVVEFELAAAFDLQGVRAPKRQCIANVCQWTYKAAECGYTPVSTFTGTYSRTGTTVTVTATAHGLSVGDNVHLNFTSGTAADGGYLVRTITANTFTVTTAASGSTSGGVTASQWYTDDDVATTTVGDDVCGKRLDSCKARFGSTFALPFGSFPGIGSYTL
jgi:lambda family phage minor tail protein L